MLGSTLACGTLIPPPSLLGPPPSEDSRRQLHTIILETMDSPVATSFQGAVGGKIEGAGAGAAGGALVSPIMVASASNNRKIDGEMALIYLVAASAGPVIGSIVGAVEAPPPRSWRSERERSRTRSPRRISTSASDGRLRLRSQLTRSSKAYRPKWWRGPTLDGSTWSGRGTGYLAEEIERSIDRLAEWAVDELFLLYLPASREPVVENLALPEAA